MPVNIKGFSDWACSRGWQIRLRSFRSQCPSSSVIRQFLNLPQDFLDFQASVELAASADNKAWFICCDDYERETGFRWNAFELISIQAAQDHGDQQWIERVKAFWSKHLPFYISARGDYGYCAIRLDDGYVVEGRSPEFEMVKVIAKSFGDFIDDVICGRINVT